MEERDVELDGHTSRVEPLRYFVRRLKGYLPGILAHCRWPLHTSLLEGINNKIKVIKRMAYGFRDDQYFFLKIRAAFPGNTGWTFFSPPFFFSETQFRTLVADLREHILPLYPGLALDADVRRAMM
jgi:hypothetical protein